MKKKSGLRKSLFFVGLGILALVFMGCETWLSGKNFFGTVEQEVKYANAEEIPVYVRYAARTMGDTSPNGRATEKVDIPFDVTAVDDTAYQFYMWAAFSTDDYPTSRQYNNLLMLNSIEEFNTEYADKLLPPSEVWFEDALSSSTKAKVINKREDVFIIPICVKRATVEQSIPKNNEENAVKNTGITIVFSRSMDKSKLINDNNTYNQEYITIQRRTGSGESVGYIDYSEYFDKATLSASGKTLTIRQRPETTGSSPDGSKMLPAGVTILVTISKDASDVLGVEMESDVKISFHTSNSTDTGAPVIEGIGIGYTTLSNAFESTSSNANTYKGSRVKDKANIWAIANDPTSPGGTGSGDGNVYELYYSIDGENVDSYNLQGYASGEYNFEPPVESDPASLLSQGGVGFSVDVSSYADGLRHLRIYGTDLYSNSGYPTYVSEAWFVKDTQAPSTENAGRIETECTTAPNGWYNANSLGQMKIKGTGIVDSPEDNENLRSPKVWWNLMTDGSTTPSAGGTGWSEVSTTAKSLKNELGITLSASTADPTTGVLPMYVSFKDDLGNVSAPTAISSLRYDNDKPVLGTMVWENASGAEILPFSNQALLDTQILRIPFTEALSGVKKLTIWRTTGSASGSVASGNALGNAGMKISYRSADSTTKTVLSSGTDYTVVFDSSTNKATVTFASDTSNYAKKTGFFYIENLLSTDQETTVFHVEVEDSAINKCATAATKAIVCDLADPEVKEAKFLDTNDDEHAVKVEYFGQTPGTERYYLSGDTSTFNATSATKIPLRLAIKESGSGVKKIKFTGDIKISASTQVYVGAAKTLLSTDDISISTTTTDNYILFKDGNNPKLKSVGSGNAYIYLTNLVAPNVNDTSSNTGNTLKVELTDFADNEKTDWNEYSCGDDDGLSKIRVDTLAPQLAATTKISLKDTGYTSTTRTAANKNPVDAVSGYTNSEYVDMEVYYPKDEGNGSGVKKLYIKSGATFDSATKIYVKKSTDTTKTQLVAGINYEIVAPDCVSFSKTFYYNGVTSDEYTLIFEDIKLSDVVNATGMSVYVYVVDSVGWSSQDWSEYKDKYGCAINYLTGVISSGAPMLGSVRSYAWPYALGASGLVVDASEKNVDNDSVYYFFENSRDNSSNSSLHIKYSLGGNYIYPYRIYKYSGEDAFTKTATEIVAASTTETTDSGTNGYRTLSDAMTYYYASPSNTESSGTKKKWSVVFVDKAGNLSEVHSFCIVKDTDSPSHKIGTGDTADDYFPFVYEDKSGSEGEQYNVMCRQDSATKYTNIYRCWSVDSTTDAKAEIYVDLSSYPDLLTTTSGTGIEWYSFDDHDADTIPTESYDTPTWGAWTRVPENKVLKMHAPTTRDSPSDGTGMHLWLKDYCGNISRVKIMKPEHAANGGYETVTEYWERDDGVEHGGWWHFADSANDSCEGKLITSGYNVYINDKAYFTLAASDCHSFFPLATGSNNNASDTSAGDYTARPSDGNYSRRVRFIWSDTARNSYTKAQVDQMGESGTSESLSEGYTPWYYSVATAQYSGSGDPSQKMRVEYPHVSGKSLYVAIEDGVGHFDCKPMLGYDYKWTYDNTPPVVSLGTDSTVSASGANAVLGPITDDNKYGFLPKMLDANNRVYINGNDVYYRGGLHFGLSVSDANVSYKWKCDGNPSASPTDSDWSDWSNSSSFTPEMTAQGAVYLHFKDIVGNITSLRLGGENILWKNDSIRPVWKSIPSEATTNSDGKKELFNSDAGYKLTYDINTNVDAANPIGTLTYVVGAGRDLVVKLDDLFEDGGTDSDVKSGLKGLNQNYTSGNGNKWDIGITPDYTISKDNITTSFNTISNLHVYDNVGNWRCIVVKYKCDASGPSYNSPSFSGTINKYGDTLYYTTQGSNKVTVSVTGIADDIGLYKYCIDHSEHTEPTESMQNLTGSGSITVDLPTSDGEALYLHLYDKLGSETSIPLTYDGLNKWRSLDTKPAAPVGVTLKESASTAETALNALFAVTDAENNKARISYLTGQITSDNRLWIYPQTASTASYIAGFSENSDGSSLVLAGTPFEKFGFANNSKINLYTVDYAGNVSQNPLEITLEEASNPISCDYEFVLPNANSVGVYDGTNYFNSTDVKVKLKDTVFFGDFASWGIGTDVGLGASSTSLTGEISISAVPELTSATGLKIWIKDTAGRDASGGLEYPHTAGNKVGTGLDSTKSTWLYDTEAPVKPTVTFSNTALNGSSTDTPSDHYNYASTPTPKFEYEKDWFDTIKITPASTSTDVVGYTTNSDGSDYTNEDFVVDVSGNKSGSITIYAVDKAGNVSEGLEIAYNSIALGSTSLEIDSDSYKTISGVNYFNGDVEVGLGWSGIATVTYWQIGPTYTKDGTDCVSATSADEKIKIPHTTAAKKMYIYIEAMYAGTLRKLYKYSDGSYATVKPSGSSVDTWCYDATAPSFGTPSFSGTTKVHGDTLYYNTTVSSNPKVAVSSISDGGVGVHGYCINGSATAPTDLTSYTQISGTSISGVAIPASSGGSLYLHVADELGNAATVQLTKDSCTKWHNLDEAPSAPTSVLIKEGSGDFAESTTNAKVSGGDITFVDGAFTSSNKLSIKPQLAGSYIAGYVEAANGTTASEYFEKYGFTDDQTISFYTMDYAGNVSATPLTVTMKKSAAIDAGYTISVPDGKIVNSFSGTNYFNSAVTVSLNSPTFFGTFDSWGVGTAVGVGAADAVNGSVDLSAISGIESGKSLIVWVKDTAGRTVSAPLAYPASTDKLSSGSSIGVTWFYDTTAPATPTLTSTSVLGKVDGTSAATNVHVDGNTIYYRADATEISFTVATITDGHGSAQYANGTSGDRTTGSLAISVDGTETTASSIYAWDAVGNICATPLTLTFVPVAAPTVTLTAGAKDGVDTPNTNPKTESGTTWYYFATDEVEITPTVTVDSNAATVGTTDYVYKAGGTEVPAGAFGITGLDSTKKYSVTEVGGFGRTVEFALPAIEGKAEWRSYVKPTGCSYTETIDDTTDDDGAVTGHHLKYVITFPVDAPGVPVMDVIATSTHNLEGTTLIHSSDGWDKKFGALTDGVYKLADTAGMGWNTTITIEYDDTNDTAAETITAITVNTKFGNLSAIKASASVSAFTRSMGIDLSSIVAGNTEDSAGNTVTRSPSIVKYFATVATTENAEPVARFASPSSFAIGNKVEVPDNIAPKKSVTSTTFDGYADSDSRKENVAATEGMESPVLSDHSWKPEKAGDAEEIALVGGKISEKSVGIVEAKDFVSDNSTAEKSKKPVDPVWFIALAAIFGTILVILQKKKRN